MRFNNLFYVLLITLGSLMYLLNSCNKLLAEPVSSDLQSPTTLADLAPLLNGDAMNYTPGLPDLMADNLYLQYSFWYDRKPVQKNAYIWKADLYEGDTSSGDYELCYSQVMNANIVLEKLATMPAASDPLTWNKLKGMACFYRSWAFYHLVQLYAPMYNAATADTDQGIPLRQTSSKNEIPKSATVQQTYDQIISDLLVATQLLPPLDINNNSEPSKTAAYALLARVCLSMGNYALAKQYADSCLLQYNKLLDYNTITTTNLPRTNPEIIFRTHVTDSMDALKMLSTSGCRADTILYSAYHQNDQRKRLFFALDSSGYPEPKKSYDGSYFFFSGLATDEVWLIRAESRARTGDTTGALNDLDTVLQKRYAYGTFVSVRAGSNQQVIDTIVAERRKELPYRSVRWSDLRRLNALGANINLKRNLNGAIYTLPANDKRYVLPFPPGAVH